MDSALTSAESGAVNAPDELARLRARVRELETQLQFRHDVAELRLDATELEATSAVLAFTGQTFFRSMLAHLSAVLQADFAFVAEPVEGHPGRVRTTLLSIDGELAPSFEYDLAGTPCGELWGRGSCLYPSGVQQVFPDDHYLVELQIESYAGTPLAASDGRVFGQLTVMHRAPFRHPARTAAMLRIFAARAAAELERLQSEEKLRRSEMLLRSILDHSTSAIYVKDAQGRYLVINPEFERTVGLSAGQVLGQTATDLLAPESARRIDSHEAEVLTKRVPIRREVTLTALALGEHNYLVDKVPLFTSEGEISGTCTIATDVTELKQLEAQLVRAQRIESVGQLAGGVAHDFNNLLTAITGFTSMALDTLASDHPARRELGEALRAGDRAADLTRRLLAFARKQVIQLRDVDLVAVIHDMRGLLRPVLGDSVRLSLRLAPGLWPVHADPTQLDQVIMNLAINARDAMPGGGALEIAATNLTLSQGRPTAAGMLPAGDYVELRVRDNGHGVPDEVREHLFEPFFTTKTGGQGTGLGLATCHGIVLQSGGHIEFESRPGEGTTFIVLLPRGKGTHDVPPSSRLEATPRGKSTVLVAEDEPLVRELAVRSLEQAGFHVLQAADGVAALACATGWQGNIDLLLTDIMMPGMDGLELAEHILKSRPGARVLLMSGYSDAALALRQARHSDWPLLNKPYTPRELSVRVRQALDAVTA